MKQQMGKVFAVMLAALFLSITVLELNAEARVGKTRSIGSRGSQSYSKPAAEQSPQRQQVAPATAQPQPGGSFMRSMAGGIMGGMLGSMLFSSFAGADSADGAAGGMGGLGGSGFGLFEILLFAGGGYMLFRFMKNRRTYSSAAASGPQRYQHEEATVVPLSQQNHTPLHGGPETGLGHIRRMDPTFDESRFNDTAMDSFFRIQGAWMNRDLAPVSDLLSEEMAEIFQADLDQLLGDKHINKLENIAVRKVEIVEATQEFGRDSITTSIYANLLDYTCDETTGAVVSGSKTEPVKFLEYWTFTRPVGSHPWRLTAIQQQ